VCGMLRTSQRGWRGSTIRDMINLQQNSVQNSAVDIYTLEAADSLYI
jgi:hypothetical protein